MCGIAGIVSSDPNNVSTERLKLMTHAIKHRGPDGEKTWINTSSTAGLGHRRLSIIDLSENAAQPMHFLDRYTIVHNGEVYNYIELKEELQKKGYAFRSLSDTEIILAAYDCWKDECMDHFDGMFAFAIWDEQEKKLFAARDRFGEKPFFYFFDGIQFIFASEMKSLWAAGIERKANLKMLFNFITIGYVDNPNQPSETFFENIYKLPAANCLTYKLHSKEISLEKYWDIDPEYENKKITDKDAFEQFSFLFSQSVKKRLRSDVSIGTSLSGGLDSSSIVAASHQFNAANFSHQCFTASFTGFEKDELIFSKLVAEKFGMQQNVVSSYDLANDLEKLFFHQEEPIGSSSAYAQFKVFELAKQQNVKVLLDGQGADETLAGYHSYYKWFWQELFLKRKLFSSKELRAARKNNVQEKFGMKNMIAAFFPDFAAVFLEHQYLLNALKHEGLTKDFVRFQSKEAYYTTPSHFTLNGLLYFNTCVHGLEELLRLADRNSMANGREIRLPFLDHALVEFIFSLPSHFKIHDGWTKWILRKSVKDELPEQIVWRKEKIGFEPPQKKWMQDSGMQEKVMSAKQKLVNEKILKPEVLNKNSESTSAYNPKNDDWRYLNVAFCL